MALSSGLSALEREQIQQWASAHGTPQQVALRCRIVLAAADGQSDVAIAQQLSVNRKTVILWRQRFSEQRLDGLWEIAPGRGRKPNYDTDKIAAHCGCNPLKRLRIRATRCIFRHAGASRIIERLTPVDTSRERLRFE